MFWYVAIPTILIILVWYFYYHIPYQYWKKLGVKYTLKPWIIFGDFWPMIFGKMNIVDVFDKLYAIEPNRRYLPVYHMSMPSLVLRDPELIKQLLVKDFEYFSDHLNFAPAEDPDGLWSQNLLNLKGKKWKDMRLLMSGAFTGNKMRFIYTSIEEVSENFTNFFLKQSSDIVEVDLKDSFTRFTTDAIATTAFGLKVDSMAPTENEFYKMGKAVVNFSGFSVVIKLFLGFACPKLATALGLSLFPSKVTNFFSNLIGDTVKIREEKGIIRPDIIQLMLEMKQKGVTEEKDDVINDGFAVVQETSSSKWKKPQVQITNRDIAAQAMAFFLAGFESVSMFMCFTAYELALNPDIQNKLRNEIEATSRKCDGKVTYELLLKMKYLDNVLTEALRKWPPIPATERVCVKPYTLASNDPSEKSITILPGQRLLIPICSIHKDPNFYPEPEKFDPERFSEGNKSKIQPYSYMPFGIGPRVCIGTRLALLEAKLVFFNLLREFEIVPIERTPIPLKLSKKAINVSVDTGFPLGLKRLIKSGQ